MKTERGENVCAQGMIIDETTEKTNQLELALYIDVVLVPSIRESPRFGNTGISRVVITSNYIEDIE